jgi:microcystin-dependent protein
MRTATRLPLHSSLLVFVAAGLTTLASCGERQTATIGGENTDATSTSQDSDTSVSSDSIGKRLGVAMPSTAVNFTEIPPRDPNEGTIYNYSGSRDGSFLVV